MYVYAEEFISILSRFQCVSVRIDIKKDLPVSVGREYQIVRKILSVNLVDLINAEDLTVILERIDELSVNGFGSLRVNCRFVPENKQYLICCEMRREKRLGKTTHYLYGVIMDVSEYNKNMEQDPAQKELIKKSLHKFSSLKAESGEMGIADIVGKEHLSRIQIPISDNYGVYSAILTESGEFVCSSDLSQTAFNVNKYKYSKKRYIKINHVIYAVWVIASDDNSFIERYSALHDILAEGLSKLANSYVMLYNEMVNTEHANKLLSETIEQQMLLNGIYTKVLNERNCDATLQAVVDMTGDFLKLDRIVVCEDVPYDEKYISVYEWNPLQEFDLKQYGTSESSFVSREFLYSDYPDLIEELGYYETYFSGNPEHDVLGFEFTSYVASNLNGDGSKYGIIIYVINNPERILTPAEKRLLRSVSQIIAAVIMRCKDHEELENNNKRLKNLAYHDQILGVKNKTSLELNVKEAIESGFTGAVIAVRFPNIENIDNFAGHDHTDELLVKVLECIYNYEKAAAEPYRYSDRIFMVLMRNITLKGVKDFCDELVERFRQPWSIDNCEHYLEITAGIAPYPESGATADEIYRAAILSMDKAEEYGANSYAFFSGEFENPKTDDYYCAQVLRSALENDMEGLVVRYVPVYCEGKIISFEAIPGLTSAMDGRVYSSHIIMQIAGKMGIDVTIDAWLIEQACEFCRKARLKSPKLSVSISASARSLVTGKIMAMVKNALTKSGLSPDGLSVQFSERIVTINYDRFITVLGEFRKIGVSVILDNLGSYYTTSSLLRHSGLSAAKTDITLLTGQIDDFDKLQIGGIMKFAKEHGVNIGVKSIQDEAQLEVELVQDVDWYQGDYYSKPMDGEEAIKKL